MSGFSSGPRGPYTATTIAAGKPDTAQHVGAARVFGSRVGPHVIDAILAGLDAIAPVAPDRFFALHYSKLALQSHETLAAWSARAAELGLASGALDELRARLATVRGVLDRRRVDDDRGIVGSRDVRGNRAATEAHDVA